MADYDVTTGSYASQAAAVSQGLTAKTAFKDFDFREQNVVATDTVQLEKLPDNCVAVGYNAQVLRAEGAAGTLNIGITGAATEIATALDCNVVGDAVTVPPTTNPITTSTNILITVATGPLVNARIRVHWTIAEYPLGADQVSI